VRFRKTEFAKAA